MNSKELLERADQRIAEIENIKKARKSIEDIENINVMLRNEITVIKLQQGTIEKQLDMALEYGEYEELQRVVEVKMNEFLARRSIKLEQLLGITPKIINPEFEVAIRDMEKQGNEPDPIEEKLKTVLEDEAKRIESPLQEKFLDKFPAKKDGRKKYPDSMTVEAVERMYCTEMKTMAQIAEHFGVKASTINNFIYLKGIKRKKSDKQADKPVEKTENKSDDKESHSQPQTI